MQSERASGARSRCCTTWLICWTLGLLARPAFGAAGPDSPQAGGSSADAATAGPRRVSALLELLVHARAEGWPLPGPELRARRPGPTSRQAVTARFTRPLTPTELLALERRGLELRSREDGTPVQIGATYTGMLVPGPPTDRDSTPLTRARATLERVAAAPLLIRLEEAGWRGPWPWLTHNLEEAGAPAVWPGRDAGGKRLTGRGMLIGDLDGSLDVFHPAFFRADGGLFSWVDRDRDGRFTPGRDGVDLDGDGQAGPAEVVQLLDGVIRNRNTWEPWAENEDGRFQPELDWLYVDADGDGARSFGPEAGYTERDPTYGERLLLGDDVDRNGRLDPGEKLIALGWSKIKLYYSMQHNVTRRRGVDLLRTPRPPASSHGTGVAGILVGNELGRHAFTGLAPDAELVFADLDLTEGDDSNFLLLGAIDWLARQGAQVMVHEYGTLLFQFGDGSSNLEQALDTLSAEGRLQCTAAHNFAGYPMHAQGELPVGGRLDFPIVVSRHPGFSIRMLYGTVRWRSQDTAPTLHLASRAGGRFVELPEQADEPVALEDGTWLLATGADVSARGTTMRNFYLWAGEGEELAPLPAGERVLRVEAAAGGARPLQLDLSVSDDTGYASLVALTEHATPAGTVAWPGTADSAVTVGAYRGNFEWFDDGVAAGALRPYSGRDPRIDGVAVLELTAPDDSPTALSDPSLPFGQFETFSGTSGALPVVAGALTLLRQARPELTPAEVRARAVEWARTEASMGPLPGPGWGYGKLALYEAIFGRAPMANAPPMARLELQGAVVTGEPLRVSGAGSRDPEGGELRFRWDPGYRGEWEGPFTPDPQWRGVAGPPGPFWLLAEVEDPEGATARALLRIDVQAEPVGEDAGTPTDGGVLEDAGDRADGAIPADGGGSADSGGPVDSGPLPADQGLPDQGADLGSTPGAEVGDPRGDADRSGGGPGPRSQQGCQACASAPAGPRVPLGAPLLALLCGLGLCRLRTRCRTRSCPRAGPPSPGPGPGSRARRAGG